MLDKMRMMGEHLREGFLAGEWLPGRNRSEKGIKVLYVNGVLLQWMNLSDTMLMKTPSEALFQSSSMPELYQIMEIEEAMVSGSASSFRIFCADHDLFYEILILPMDPCHFAMIVKSQSAHAATDSVVKVPSAQEKMEASLRFLMDSMSDVIWRIDSDFRYTYISGSVQKIRGYTPTELIGRPLWNYISQDGVRDILGYHREILAGPVGVMKSRTIEVEVVCSDGSKKWTETIFDPIYNHLGMWTGYQGVSRDITDRKKTEASLMEFHGLIEKVLENMAQAMVVIDSRQEVAVYNRKFMELFGFTEEESLSGLPFEKALKLWRERWETSRDSLQLDIDRIHQQQLYSEEYWQRSKAGDVYWIEMFHSPLPGGGFVRTYTDITERKRHELDFHENHEKLVVMASTDDLTGVLNRRSGFQMLKKMETDCLERGRSLALCFIDVDNLKKTNDRYGHGAGDELLQVLSGVIRQSIRSEDAVCRVGGDEFMILFPGCDKDTAHRLVERIQQNLKTMEGIGYPIQFSFGIEHLSPENPIPVEELIRRADREMYRYKTKRKTE